MVTEHNLNGETFIAHSEVVDIGCGPENRMRVIRLTPDGPIEVWLATEPMSHQAQWDEFLEYFYEVVHGDL